MRIPKPSRGSELALMIKIYATFEDGEFMVAHRLAVFGFPKELWFES